ncbi:hypothetical protein [Roseomonas sp. 18066]|uniref:hypothetical protein n=1 Tax=Roseomonas sp. 18066 TaxID=2681412 RepID=UPI00135CE116|nr:hypothetical protein [Roseomonas sp. 18066]
MRIYPDSKAAAALDTSADTSIAAHMRDLRARLAETEAHEAAQGLGSLRTPAHPFNKRMDEMMRRLEESWERASWAS